MSQQRSLEQERAAKAWTCIVQVRDSGKGYAKEYGSLAKRAPADIQSNGLGQTLAFWRAKGYDKGKPKNNGADEHCQLLLHVSDWVKGRLKSDQNLTLFDWIVQKASTDDYRRATTEAMAFLSWIKRFAEAELGGNDGVPDPQEKR